MHWTKPKSGQKTLIQNGILMMNFGKKSEQGEAKEMYKIQYMDSVEHDVLAIENNPKIDSRTFLKIEKDIEARIASLDTMPLRYPVYLHRPQYRVTGVHKYVIFYKVTENPKTVEIHRILHGARDIENLTGDV
jgi:plasmid stabilization system protein ParE